MTKYEEHDILITKVVYSDGAGSKVRPVVIVKLDGETIRTFRITSKYENKSDEIKARYFEIIDWYQSGLKKQSWIDTISYYDISENMAKIKLIGSLTARDAERLREFLSNIDF
ncbi:MULTISPECIES: hypothetical protein [Streptococcus]|uniref:Type II toxin-antitoxin system PemK/MazF family toxin n=1 Tax=Streptococcus caledonicus TaxID=2614158 RepID=A0ABW0UI67_9STRE|nr:hypothetical protein [Streptococcus sp. S784/96/1]